VSWKARYSANYEDDGKEQFWVPCTIEVLKTYIPDDPTQDGTVNLRISYLPHIAGVLVLEAKSLKITSSNSAFSSALFGRRNLCGLEIGEVLPNFRRLVHFLAREQNEQKRRRGLDGVESKEDDSILEEGTVVPEHAFRRAEAMLELRQVGATDMTPSTSSSGSTISTESEVESLTPDGSGANTPINESPDDQNGDDGQLPRGPILGESLLSGGLLIKPHGLRGIHRDGGEVVVDVQMRVVRPTANATSDSPSLDKVYYALWITYSGPRLNIPPLTPLPPVEPEPVFTPSEVDTFSSDDEIAPDEPKRRRSSIAVEAIGIEAWETLEEMGEGAYGSVKLVRNRRDSKRVNPLEKN
jgi:protein-serine/threonine kinase